MENFTQSEAKPQNIIGESSETISKESTHTTPVCGSANPSARKGGGDDIVQKRNLDKFINKANIKFDNKFDYSQVEYVNAKTKVKIICPEHGEFWLTPDKHLQSKYGCPECVKKYKDTSKWEENRKKGNDAHRISKEEYLERANRKYNNKYTYIIDDWKGICDTTIRVICPIHGEFQTNARNHILKNNSTGCPQCGSEKSIKSKTTPYDDVIELFNKKYNGFYTYPDENRDTYINKSSKIKIICPKHGEFIRSAQKHLSGLECLECEIERIIDRGLWPGGYNDELFENHPEYKDLKANLYYFEINNGEFYKIGISRNDPKRRASALKSHAKEFGELVEFKLLGFKETTLYKAYKAEQKILNYFKKYRIKKKWSTELFNTNIYEYIKKIF